MPKWSQNITSSCRKKTWLNTLQLHFYWISVIVMYYNLILQEKTQQFWTTWWFQPIEKYESNWVWKRFETATYKCTEHIDFSEWQIPWFSNLCLSLEGICNSAVWSKEEWLSRSAASKALPQGTMLRPRYFLDGKNTWIQTWVHRAGSGKGAQSFQIKTQTSNKTC